MARLFDSPLTIMVIAVVILLMFGAPKLPAMARSLGQSMRIFKSEVSEMKNDSGANTNDDTTVPHTSHGASASRGVQDASTPHVPPVRHTE